MGKTIGEMIEDARKRSGAQQYSGHDIMDLMRFDENTRHMVVFDVLSNECPIGTKEERKRLFLSDQGYQNIKNQAEIGNIKMLNHAKVVQGHLHYDHKDQIL